MPFIDTNGTRLYYELQGSGPPIVFAHGAFGDHHVWDGIVPRLTDSFLVVTYDRRGHSQSAAPPGPQGIAEDVEDLAGMLTALAMPPIHLVGTSGGAAMSLHFAARRPELLSSVAVHEPPFIGLVGEVPQYAQMAAEVQSGIASAASLIEAGKYAEATGQFIDNVAVGPGTWAQLPEPIKQAYAANAPAFLDDSHDPLLDSIDTNELAAFEKPILVTRGDQSPTYYHGTFDLLAEAVPVGKFVVLEGAGHSPYRSHPDEYLQTLRAFLSSVDD